MSKKSQKTYMESVHTYGRIWMLSAGVMMIMVPVSLCLHYDAWPRMNEFLQGLLGIAPIFWTVGVIEDITYIPMLGVGGSYLAFVTGNLTNLKVPCAVSAMEIASVKSNTEEGELISTISIAVSSIVTTIIIALGVLGLTQLRPLLESPVLEPSFANILPALFGALGVVLISRDWKVAVAPVLFMLLLFLLMPGLAGSVAILVPVGILIALGAARILYERGLM